MASCIFTGRASVLCTHRLGRQDFGLSIDAGNLNGCLLSHLGFGHRQLEVEVSLFPGQGKLILGLKLVTLGFQLLFLRCLLGLILLPHALHLDIALLLSRL